MSTIAEAMTVAKTEADKADVIAARNELTLKHQGLVRNLARLSVGRGVPYEDLVNEGNLGLIAAAERFDPSLGYAFSTYARVWIRKMIFRVVARTGHPIRIADHIASDVAAVFRREKDMMAGGGDAPRISDVLAAMEADGTLDPKDRGCLVDGIKARRAKFGTQSSEDLDRMALDAPSSPEPELIEEHREQLSLALPLLTKTQRAVLTLRYGLDRDKALTVKATAIKLRIDSMTVEYLEHSAIKKLRNHLNQFSRPERNP